MGRAEPGSRALFDNLQVELSFRDDGLSCHLSCCSQGQFPGSGDLSNVDVAGDFIFVRWNSYGLKRTAAPGWICKQVDGHGAGEVGGAFQLQSYIQGLPGMTGNWLVE